MSSSPANTRASAQLVALLRSIPAGYVATHGAVARFLKLDQRHVMTLLQSFDEATRAETPWWRLVADGGAVGRHTLRAEQIARLAADGVPLSPVGIVQELADRRINDLVNPPSEPFKLRATTPSGALSRSRGMKSHPDS